MVVAQLAELLREVHGSNPVIINLTVILAYVLCLTDEKTKIKKKRTGVAG